MVETTAWAQFEEDRVVLGDRVAWALDNEGEMGAEFMFWWHVHEFPAEYLAQHDPMARHQMGVE